jgi:tripartite-type tricarboxylate transporter receptor subunit TctC
MDGCSAVAARSRAAAPTGATSAARRALCLALAGGAAAWSGEPAWSQAMNLDAWPTQPVRVVVGTPAGSTYDFMLRTMQPPLRASLGQPIVIEHRVGADQILAARRVAGAAADGYTVLAGTRTLVAVNPVLHANLGYDPDRDLLPVTLLGKQILLVAVHPSLPVSTLAELAAWSRAHPNKLNYGAGSGAIMLAGEALKGAIGADMTHVPYNGLAPTLQALLAGDVQVGLVDVTSAQAAIRAGRVRALVVSGARRLPQLPDVPTFTEAGFPSADLPLWNALFAPAGTPDAIVARLRAAIVAVLEDREIADKLVGAGVVPETSTPEELRSRILRERAEVNALVNRLGIAPK